MDEHLQKPSAKDCRDSNLFGSSRLQFPKGCHRKEKDRKIRHHIENGAGFIRGEEIVAVTARMYSRLPKLLPGIAHADLEARSNGIEYKATANENVNASKHGLVILAVWDEDPEILKQN